MVYLSKRVLDGQLVVNVKDFGAKGNGSHDDSPAIKAAIAYAMHKGSLATFHKSDGSQVGINDPIALNKIQYPAKRTVFATQGGATLYFPSGTYVISEPIVLPASGGNYSFSTNGFAIQIEGENAVSTTIIGRTPGIKDSSIPMLTYSFAQKEFGEAPMQIRGLIEWDPYYNFKGLTSGGLSPGAKPKLHKNTWENTRIIRKWKEEDEEAENELQRIFGDGVKSATGKKLLKKYLDRYKKAIDDLDVALKAGLGYCRAQYQSIRNLTLYCAESPMSGGVPSQAIKSYAIYRRWPWVTQFPRLFSLIDALLASTPSTSWVHAEDLVKKPYKGSFKPGSLMHEWQQVTIRLGKGQHSKHSMETSRLQLRLEDVNFLGANNVYHPAYCRFEGSVYNSQFKNITAKVSNRLKRAVPQNWHARSESPDTAPSHDIVLFEFDDGQVGDTGDAVGFQLGTIEDVQGYGKQLCLFKGRISASTWDGAFSDGTLFGPSFHFVNSMNSSFRNLYHEGGTDRHVFLLENCLGLRFTGFGSGGQRLHLGTEFWQSAVKYDWPQFALDAIRKLSSPIKLVASVACEFEGRTGLWPIYTTSNYFTHLLAEGHNAHMLSSMSSYTFPQKREGFRMTTAFIELDRFCYRNTFSNIETCYLNTGLPILYQQEAWAANIVKGLKLGMDLNPLTALNNFLHEEFQLPNTEGLDRNLNHVSGWVYIREDVQGYFEGEFYEFEGSRNVMPKGKQWGGRPFSIGRKYDASSSTGSNQQLKEAERSIKLLKEELRQLKEVVGKIKPENHFHIYNQKGDVAEDPKPKFCSKLRVAFMQIEVFKSGAIQDVGDFAEWSMNLTANGATTRWKADVKDGEVHAMNKELVASLFNEQDTLRVEVSGFEDDFPWLWEDLPSVSRVFGKTDHWGMQGGPHVLARGNEAFSYRITFKVECLS